MSDTCFFKSPVLHCEEAGGIGKMVNLRKVGRRHIHFLAPD
jgi:hypothetical protein